MDLNNSHFHFNAVLKNEQDVMFEALQLFPGLDEIAFQSRIFDNYAECVKSCKGLMEDMTSEVNISRDLKNFKVGAEVNPKHTGTATFSKDWDENEVARFWIYDKNMEGTGNIAAICRASIYTIPKTIESFH